MYERLLNESEKYLEKQKEKEVSILELWDAMVETAEEHKFEMPDTIGDFEYLIEADQRFIFHTAEIAEEPDEDLDLGEEEGEYEVGEDFFDVEEMENIGFNQNQTVSLKKNAKKNTADDDGSDAFAPHLGKSKKGHEKKVNQKDGTSSKKKNPLKRTPSPKRKK